MKHEDNEKDTTARALSLEKSIPSETCIDYNAIEKK